MRPPSPPARPALLAAAFLLLASLTSPAAPPSSPPSPQPKRARILTTLAPVYSWTASIAGDLVDVQNLLPPQAGPHNFQFRPRDLEKVRSADLILGIGLGIEQWLTRAIENNAQASGIRLVEVSQGWEANLIRDLPVLDTGGKIRDDHDHDHGHDHDHDHAANPHVWLDPLFARHAVTNILAALERVAPAHAEGFRSNARVLLESLQALDSDYRKACSSATHRRVVTFHDAFPYLARRYQLDLVGVVQAVPSVSPSPRYLKKLSDAIRRKQPRVIFTEPQFNPQLARQLARDLNVRIAELDTLETGPTSASFYLDGMRRNLKVLEAELR